ncbi:MAG: hypothetical protein KA953_00620 [Lachnospiraceae bacterium]|nr:hypothetical protein [Lachnospiraceae bacterium]
MKNIDRHDVQKVLAYWVVDHKDIHSALNLLGCKYTDDINKWLLSDYLPFTDFELEIMRHIDTDFHYLARDFNGVLYIYTSEVEKDLEEDEWVCPLGTVEIWYLVRGCFKSITWEDGPVCIDDYVKRG